MKQKFIHSILLIIILSLLAATQPVAASSPDSPQVSTTDLVGVSGSGSFGSIVKALSNGNFVVTDPDFNNGMGAVYLYNGKTHTLISTLVGSIPGDGVGSFLTLVNESDFVVHSGSWADSTGPNPIYGVGAVTFCSGTTGCSGVVSSSNSLVGSHAGDIVGAYSIVPRIGGGYVVRNPQWNNSVGSVTGCPATGCTGIVSSSNSLVGSAANDQIGASGVLALPSGAYVVLSPFYSKNGVSQVGAATYCPTVGCSGPIISSGFFSNSLVGSSALDHVGGIGAVLAGGGYVVWSTDWDNGAQADVGAVTACPVSGCRGTVSLANSLAGSQPGDKIGYDGVTPLPDGSFVVASRNWSSGSTANVGAVTHCPAAGCAGFAINQNNSLIGSHSNDLDNVNITVLTGGGYVVASPSWTKGAVASAGAITACPAAGCTGVINVSNSMVGSTSFDFAFISIQPLPDGSFVVGTPTWSGNKGAVTHCPVSGCAGLVISSLISLVGSKTGDWVGGRIYALADGSYVTSTASWANGAYTQAGAVTHCPASGCIGTISPANSLVGSSTQEFVGSDVFPLVNGNYVVISSSWDNGGILNVGALTLCKPAGCTGPVNTSNSLVGKVANDSLGGQVIGLPSGGYMFRSVKLSNGTLSNAGGLTLCPPSGCIGLISNANTIWGGVADKATTLTYDYDSVNNVMIVGKPMENRVSFLSYEKRVYLPILKR